MLVEVTDKSQITLPNSLGVKQGDKFHISRQNGGIVLFPIPAVDGVKYNQYGEPCYDPEDDLGEDVAALDAMYSAMCTQEELDESRKLISERRKRIIESGENV